jgi:hypothetical protein
MALGREIRELPETQESGTFTSSANSYLKVVRRPAMKQDVLARLKHAQLGEPIWQPVIFAILVVLISITLALICQA